MLHGRAAEGALLEMLMTGMGWVGYFAPRVEFVFVDAIHPCEKRSHLYAALDARGMYCPNGCRDYGMLEVYSPEEADKDGDKVAESVAHVESLLEADPLGFDGIGGICDGALIASHVASCANGERRRPLSFLLNMAGMPWEFMPPSLEPGKALISLPSAHFLGLSDEILSQERLDRIPSRCVDAEVVRHPGGHAVPRLRPSIAECV
eukprot:4427452-Prymnesium_polylepis.1